jgi:hypothetical protein
MRRRKTIAVLMFSVQGQPITASATELGHGPAD